MASSWLSKVMGTTASRAPSVLGLPPDSYQLQQQQQQEHLTPRACFQVFINLKGARNLPEISRKKGFHITLRGLENTGNFALETPAVEKPEDLHFPGEHRMLHMEPSAIGISLELTATRNMLPQKALGRVTITFRYLQQQKDQSVEAWFSLGNEKRAPELLVKARLVEVNPVAAPFLLRAVKGEFQKDNLETIVPKKRVQVPEGRWSTRVMLDHFSEEKYLVRVRRAKVKTRYQRQFNSAVEEWEKEVCIFQQRVLFDAYHRRKTTLHTGSIAGWAEQIIDTRSFKINGHIQREWILFGTKDITFKVQRDVHNAQWFDNLRLQLTGEGFGYPVELRIGRHLQYEVSGARNKDPQYESGFVTVIRKTPDFPSGKATALFNWKAIAMEVLLEENVMMVMLMTIVVAIVVQSWYEEETTDIQPCEKTKTKIRNSYADKNGIIWGTVNMDPNNSMALAALLRQLKESSYLNIDAKGWREELNKMPQSEWPPEIFEMINDIFGGGVKLGELPGFEGGYFEKRKSRSALELGGDGGGGSGGDGGACGGGGCGDNGGGDGGGDTGGSGDGGGGGGGGGGCGGGGGGGGGCGGGGGGGSNGM